MRLVLAYFGAVAFTFVLVGGSALLLAYARWDREP